MCVWVSPRLLLALWNRSLSLSLSLSPSDCSFFNFVIKSEYVEDIYQTFLKAQREGLLAGVKEEITAMCPPPMHTMLEKQPRDAATKKKRERTGGAWLFMM